LRVLYCCEAEGFSDVSRIISGNVPRYTARG
jgi:hypothetical protein